MKIKSKNQYQSVLREIDGLLELSHLDNFQSQKLKGLLDALDEYQSIVYEQKADITTKLADQFMLQGLFKFN